MSSEDDSAHNEGSRDRTHRLLSGETKKQAEARRAREVAADAAKQSQNGEATNAQVPAQPEISTSTSASVEPETAVSVSLPSLTKAIEEVPEPQDVPVQVAEPAVSVEGPTLQKPQELFLTPVEVGAAVALAGGAREVVKAVIEVTKPFAPTPSQGESASEPSSETGREREAPSERNTSKLSYVVIRETLDRGEWENGDLLSNEERKDLTAERRQRYREAEGLGVLERARKPLEETLVESVWAKDDFVTKIGSLASTLETQAGMVRGYRRNSRLEGVVQDAVNATALLAIRDGLEEARPETLERLGGRPALERVRQQIKEEVLWDPGIPRRGYKALIDRETPAQAEISRQRAEEQRRRADEAKERQRQQDELLKALAKQSGASGMLGGMSIEAYQEKLAADTRALFLDEEESGTATIPQNMAGFLYGLKEEEKGFWQWRTVLAAGRTRKQGAIEANDLFPNPELATLRKDALQSLTDAPGVSEAVAIYAVLLARPDLTVKFLTPMGLKDIRDIKSTQEFRVWRRNLRTYLAVRFNLSVSQARDAEQVAQGLIFSSNLLEKLDYRMNKFYCGVMEYGESARDRLKVAELVNGTTRDLVYPIYKAVGEAENFGKDGKVGLKDESKRRVWPKNVLGEWLAKHWSKRPIQDVESGRIDVLQTEPLIKSFFEWVKFGGDSLLVEKDGVFENRGLIAAGLFLLEDNGDEYKLDWSAVEYDRPFALYLLYQVSPARLIFQTLEAGGLPKDKGVDDLINAFAALGTVSKETRDTLYVLTEGVKLNINPSRKNFELPFDPLARRLRRQAMESRYPQYWRVGLPE